jgi:sarcosine oxidase
VRCPWSRRAIASSSAPTGVVAAGPWAAELLEPLGIALPLGPGVAQVTFFAGPGLVDRPAFADWGGDGRLGVYGHAVPGVGYKLGFDAADGSAWDPDATAYPPDAGEVARLLRWMTRHAPGIALRPLSSERHPWTMTPDGDPVLDRRGPVVFAAGCSGHSFKLAPAFAEALADLAEGRDAGPDAGHLRLDRPALHGRPDALALGSAPIVR